MKIFARAWAFIRSLLDNLFFLLKIGLGALLAFAVLWVLNAFPWEQAEVGREMVQLWVQRVETAVRLVGGVFVGTWSVRFWDRAFLKNTLSRRLGVLSWRDQSPLRFFTYAWSHWNDAHLFANTPLLLLFTGVAVLVASSLQTFLAGSVVIMLLLAFGTIFFLPPNGVAAGASGMVWGYYGFSVVYGLIRGPDWRLAVSLVLIFLFWRRAYHNFVNKEARESSLTHFMGFVGGCVAALWLTRIGF